MCINEAIYDNLTLTQSVSNMTQNSEEDREFFYVFVDTNLVKSNKGIQNIFNTQFFDNLILLRDFINQSYGNRKNIQIILPELVTRERYSQKTQNLQRDFQKFLPVFSDFNHPTYDELVKICNKLPELVPKFGQESLKRKQIIVTPPFDPKYLDRIVSKALNYEAPFGKNDKGFKDSLIWYSIVEFTKLNIKQKKAFIVFFTNDKEFDFKNLKKEFAADTGMEILVLKTGGDARIKYYDPEFGSFISHILQDLDTSIQLTDLEISYIKNINEAILCSVKVNPLPINFAYLITDDLRVNGLKENVAEPIIKFLKNLKFDTIALSSNIKENPLVPEVTVYLRNFKEWFLDILEIELIYDCDSITIEDCPDWNYDLSYYDDPENFRSRHSEDIARHLEKMGYGIIDPKNVFFEEVEYVHYE